jgi:hypothetical protein
VDQLQECVRLIKNEPTSRRIVMTAWNPAGVIVTSNSRLFLSLHVFFIKCVCLLAGLFALCVLLVSSRCEFLLI